MSLNDVQDNSIMIDTPLVIDNDMDIFHESTDQPIMLDSEPSITVSITGYLGLSFYMFFCDIQTSPFSPINEWDPDLQLAIDISKMDSVDSKLESEPK